MTDFNPGDRVRVLTNRSVYDTPNRLGALGTVLDSPYTAAGEVCVQTDGAFGGNFYRPKDLVLLADEPVTLATQRAELLAEAGRIISGERDVQYGTPEDNQQRIADLWSVLFGIEVTPRQACLALILVKIAREVNQPKRDNLVDIAGYAAIADEVTPTLDGASATA